MLARTEVLSKSNAAMKEDRVLMWTNVIDVIRFLWSFSWYNRAEKKQPKENKWDRGLVGNFVQ